MKYIKKFETLDYSKISYYKEEIERYLDSIKDDFKMYVLSERHITWVFSTANISVTNYKKSKALQQYVKGKSQDAEGFCVVDEFENNIYVILGFDSYFLNRHQEVYDYIEEFESRLFDSFEFTKQNLGDTFAPGENQQLTLCYKITTKK